MRLCTPELVGGLKTSLFEGPKSIGSLWEQVVQPTLTVPNPKRQRMEAGGRLGRRVSFAWIWELGKSCRVGPSPAFLEGSGVVTRRKPPKNGLNPKPNTKATSTAAPHSMHVSAGKCLNFRLFVAAFDVHWGSTPCRYCKEAGVSQRTAQKRQRRGFS